MCSSDLEDEGFRNGYKMSDELRYTINNLPTIPVGTISDVSKKFGEKIDPIDVSEYFDSQDGDTLIYGVSYDKAYGIKSTLTKEGILTLEPGNRQGTYTITVTAHDGSGEEPVEQKFNLSVVNQPLTKVKDFDSANPEKITLKVPGNEVADYPEQYIVKCSEYFKDPDGFPPRIAILGDETERVVEWFFNSDTREITFYAIGEGERNVEVIAMDENAPEDPDCQLTAAFIFEVVNPAQKWILPVIIGCGIGVLLLAFLAFMFLGRKIYGTWDIYSRGAGSEMDRNLAATANGSKASCRLDSLLDEIGMEPGFGNVMLVAGNKLSKDVFLTGLDGMSVEVNGEPVEDPKKLKKLPIRPGQEVVITSDYSSVTLQRTRI